MEQTKTWGGFCRLHYQHIPCPVCSAAQVLASPSLAFHSTGREELRASWLYEAMETMRQSNNQLRDQNEELQREIERLRMADKDPANPVGNNALQWLFVIPIALVMGVVAAIKKLFSR